MNTTIGQPRDVRARAACVALANKIAEVTARGYRPEAWDAEEVANTDRAFIASINRWERTGDEGDFAAAREAGADCVRAWRRFAL